MELPGQSVLDEILVTVLAIDFGDCLLILIVQTNDLRLPIVWNYPNNGFRRPFITWNCVSNRCRVLSIELSEQLFSETVNYL